ncbi:pectate lyase [Brevifollis gellanilyticus]|uniref:Pectate lyase n=2 Tax=Brevifollis gellanilyticus TaxID=748831 RepID=A0A512MA36_9BACT|nr:pectate lyase [Brevifollis gellanilyticus]
MHATGGRGGEVVIVTNLNAKGPGSLAEAVSQPNRIVVFGVSGIIDISKVGKPGREKPGVIEISQPGITVAGQTAPGEGICIRGGALQIHASNVVLRHLRSRRGWNSEGDTGDSIEFKAASLGEAEAPAGQTQEAFDKRKDKKLERGRFVHEFAGMTDVIVDHCSASWATDENLTCTHVDRATVSWSIAAEGLDYANPKQTPPNHSEGGLWGSGAPDGRATMHHMLFAHNRLRNPRLTGGDDVPAVLNMYNCVVYDWSEYATHTGSERVFFNWTNNAYKRGPSTPAQIAGHAFEFHGDPGARVFAKGNLIAASAEATANNKLAVSHNQKFKKVSESDKEAMKADAPFGELPVMQSAREAYEAVLADTGATLPARDAVDLRIVSAVREGKGAVIGKETDLPEDQRWPDYRSLPAPADADKDGLPDFWEVQFGLDPKNAKDSADIAAGGYANIEHYINNTHPRGADQPVVSVAATVSRAHAGQPGEWRVMRSGDLKEALTVSYEVSGDAASGRDYQALSGSVTIPAGQASAMVPLTPAASAGDNKTVVITLKSGSGVHVGCPSASLIVIRQAKP